MLCPELKGVFQFASPLFKTITYAGHGNFGIVFILILLHLLRLSSVQGYDHMTMSMQFFLISYDVMSMGVSNNQ